MSSPASPRASAQAGRTAYVLDDEAQIGNIVCQISLGDLHQTVIDLAHRLRAPAGRQPKWIHSA
jgi:hypothetical protein